MYLKLVDILVGLAFIVAVVAVCSLGAGFIFGLEWAIKHGVWMLWVPMVTVMILVVAYIIGSVSRP